MNKWIVMALAAAALGFAGCGDDDEGGVDCLALGQCLAGCGMEGEDNACTFGCMEKHPEEVNASLALAACQSENACEDASCMMEKCKSEVDACGYDRDSLAGEFGDDGSDGADCAEAEQCLRSCSTSSDPGCVSSCTDPTSAATYGQLLGCASPAGCYEGATMSVDEACAAENCPTEYAACNY